MADRVGGHGASLKSWIACLIILAGFVVGGIALIYWNWAVFWAGVGIAAVGVIVARAVNVMEDVTEYGGVGGHRGTDPEGSY